MDSSLRTLDALHLAAAIDGALTVVTADREFAKAAKRHNVHALLVK